MPPITFDLSTKVVERDGVIRLTAPPETFANRTVPRFQVTFDDKPAHYSVDRDTSELRVEMPPAQPGNQGDGSRRVRVLSEDGHEIAHFQVQEVSFDLHFWAVFLALISTLILFWLVMWAADVNYRLWTDEARGGAVRAFFIDQQTMTYSLARFQFFAWTAAAVFAYTYLVISRAFQHAATLPEVPLELAELFALSTGTSLLATAITTKKGSEGSGDMIPRLSDLLTVGGVVAVDKAQFFIWTILGVASFIETVVALRPLEMTTLPPIPKGLLALSGVSAAGYLGGKLSRKPGPVILEASLAREGEVTAPGSGGTIILRGQNLSVDATIKIDNHELRSIYLAKDSSGHRVPVVITPGDDRTEPTLVKALALTVEFQVIPPDDVAVVREWFSKPGEHRIALTNLDGQMALARYQVAGPMSGAAPGSSPSSPPQNPLKL